MDGVIEEIRERNAQAYRRNARRLRARQADPVRLQNSLAQLAARSDLARARLAHTQQLLGRNLPQTATSTFRSQIDARDFVEQVETVLAREGLLTFSSRQGLLQIAARAGIARFEANLLIALVQHRSGQSITGRAINCTMTTKSFSASPRGSARVVKILATLLTAEALLGLAIWEFLLKG